MALRLAARTTRPAVPDDPALDAAHPGPLVWTWDPLHRCRAPRAFEAPTFRSFLCAIQCPTLAIDGGISSFRPDDSADRRDAVPDLAHIVVPGAGHLVHHDRPDTLARHIADHFGAP